MVVGVFLPLVRGGGAGADEGHFAPEDVEELGEFVQGGFADEFADAGLSGAVREDGVPDDAGIPVELEHHAAFNGVLALEALLFRFGVRDHGANLVHSEPSLNRVYSRKLAAICCGCKYLIPLYVDRHELDDLPILCRIYIFEQ